MVSCDRKSNHSLVSDLGYFNDLNKGDSHVKMQFCEYSYHLGADTSCIRTVNYDTCICFYENGMYQIGISYSLGVDYEYLVLLFEPGKEIRSSYILNSDYGGLFGTEMVNCELRYNVSDSVMQGYVKNAYFMQGENKISFEGEFKCIVQSDKLPLTEAYLKMLEDRNPKNFD